MPQVFGLDIASIVSEAVQAAGGLSAATLIKTGDSTRNAADPGTRIAPSISRHQLEAVIETKSRRDRDTAVAETMLVLTIIAGSIVPVAVPAVNDRVELEGSIYTLTRLIALDPAGATYQFEVR